MAKKLPTPDKLHPKYVSPAKSLARIVDELDGREWDADTTETIARICRLAGYQVRDLDEPDPRCTCHLGASAGTCPVHRVSDELQALAAQQANPLADHVAEALTQGTVYVVILEWNHPPSEVTGDPGLVGVYATQELAEAAALAERIDFDTQGKEVYQYTYRPGRYPDETGICDHCGAELKETGSCDNDHDSWEIDVHVREAIVQQGKE